jgi:hypothetical protein
MAAEFSALIMRIPCRIAARKERGAESNTTIGTELSRTRGGRICIRGAPELLDDFFDEVERVCKEKGISDHVVTVEAEEKDV